VSSPALRPQGSRSRPTLFFQKTEYETLQKPFKTTIEQKSSENRTVIGGNHTEAARHLAPEINDLKELRLGGERQDGDAATRLRGDELRMR